MMMIRAHIQWHWDRFKRISASERTLTALILDLDFKHPLPINHFQVSEEAQGPKWSLRLLILSSTRSEHLWTVRKIWHFYEVSDSSDTFLKCEINTLWSVSHFSEVSEASDTFLMCREVSEESDTSRSSEQSWTVFWHFLNTLWSVTSQMCQKNLHGAWAVNCPGRRPQRQLLIVKPWRSRTLNY